MVFILLITCMYLKLTNNPTSHKESGLRNVNITFARNSQNIVRTISFPNLSLAHCLWKVCLRNATNKKPGKIKLKIYKHLKSLKMLKNCTKKHQFYLQFKNQGFKKFTWYGYAENTGITCSYLQQSPREFYNNLPWHLPKI